MGKDDSSALAEQSVQAARVMWEAGNHKKLKLGFDPLLRLFKTDSSLEEIGEKAGVTHERMRQIYNKYFRPVFNNQSVRNRRSWHTSKNRIAKLKQAERELLKDRFVRKIAKKARDAGCVVEALPRMDSKLVSYGAEVMSTALLVNGYRCSIHRITVSKRSPKQKQSYARTSLSYGVVCKADAFIIYTSVPGFPEHTFVIPSTVLRQAYFDPPSRNQKTFSLPTEKFTGTRHKYPFIDVWEYEDAWNMLPPKP
jgi:hypothetical protein